LKVRRGHDTISIPGVQRRSPNEFFQDIVSSMMKIYSYQKCSTCRKVLDDLDKKGTKYELFPIYEQPPTKKELKRMLDTYDGRITKLFNTSGLEYKRLNLKEKLPGLTEEEAIALLASNGKLVKRPFVMDGESGWVGSKVR